MVLVYVGNFQFNINVYLFCHNLFYFDKIMRPANQGFHSPTLVMILLNQLLIYRGLLAMVFFLSLNLQFVFFLNFVGFIFNKKTFFLNLFKIVTVYLCALHATLGAQRNTIIKSQYVFFIIS